MYSLHACPHPLEPSHAHVELSYSVPAFPSKILVLSLSPGGCPSGVVLPEGVAIPPLPAPPPPGCTCNQYLPSDSTLSRFLWVRMLPLKSYNIETFIFEQSERTRNHILPCVTRRVCWSSVSHSYACMR